MNISMQLAVLVTAACLCLSEGAPDVRLTRKQTRPTRGFKNVEMMTARGFGKRDHPTRSERDVSRQQSSERTSRGQPVFKSPSVGIARDFGKRTPENDGESEWYAPIWRIYKPKSLMVANGFGKRDSDDTVGEVYGLDNFWETLEASPERDGQEGDEKTFESIPMDWFVNEMLNNPDFTRSVVRKFIDLNQDGVLTSEELLRNVI